MIRENVRLAQKFEAMVRSDPRFEIPAARSETEIIQLDHLDPVANFDLINEKKGELNQLRQKRLEGTMVRAKARWIDQGEKPSRYFCSLENRNFVSKRMVSLIKSNGTEVNEFDLITC